MNKDKLLEEVKNSCILQICRYYNITYQSLHYMTKNKVQSLVAEFKLGKSFRQFFDWVHIDDVRYILPHCEIYYIRGNQCLLFNYSRELEVEHYAEELSEKEK